MTTCSSWSPTGYRAIAYDRHGHAASSQPLHDIDEDTYDDSIAETCVHRFDNIFSHIWAGPRPRVHYRFTEVWIDQSFGGMSSSVPGWIRLGLPPMAARFAS